MRILDEKLLSEFDPEGRMEQHFAEINYLLEEAKKLIETALKVDDSLKQRLYAIQISEKLYKVFEKCIKALEARYEVLKTMSESKAIEYIRREGFPSYLHGTVLNELRRYQLEGVWSSRLYRLAARIFSEKFNEKLIRKVWSIAYWTLHIRSFHEMDISIDEVRQYLLEIEQLVNRVEKLLTQS